MTKKNGTKRSLLMSAVALVLCFSMLVGSTFAWFTDSVTSSGNIIKSGKLDVEMSWADGKADPTDAATVWTDASTGAIFNNDKWEPGYVEVRHIQIKNAGTLALKYQLSIAANGAVSDLADVIDVYYTDPAEQIADRADLAGKTPMGNLTAALAGMSTTAYGELPAGESHTVTLALKMQETAGNEYQDLSIGSDFSVVLMATQKDYESDSFDNTYDATVEIPEMDIKKVNGVTYGAGADGNYYMISVDDYTPTNFTVDNAVTVLGTGNGVNDNDRVFGKNAPLTSLTLPEGLVEIKDNALNTLPNLTSVNLPSTLKTIGIQSFRITGMSEVTIPESVETVKLGAFRDMANLTTVTVKGNVAFDNYAFRSCPNLTSIYLLGDDVTFAGSQFACHSDNGDATGITIYVKNATVAARVYAAQTSAYGYEVKILGADANGSDATAVEKVANDTAFDTAITSGTSAVVLGSGNYSLPDGGDGADLRGKELTVVGTANTVIDVSDVDTRDQFVTGATMVFDGVTLNFNDGSGFIYMGFANTKSLTYKNCKITGLQFLYGENVTFENCVIDSSANTGEPHAAWTYGAKNVTFTDCEFIYGDRAVNCYKDQDIDGGKQVVNFKNCTFTTTKNGSEGAVEINSGAFSVGIEVNMDGCTAPAEGDMVFISKWDGTNGAKTTINVNGVKIDNATVDHD